MNCVGKDPERILELLLLLLEWLIFIASPLASLKPSSSSSLQSSVSVVGKSSSVSHSPFSVIFCSHFHFSILSASTSFGIRSLSVKCFPEIGQVGCPFRIRSRMARRSKLWAQQSVTGSSIIPWERGHRNVGGRVCGLVFPAIFLCCLQFEFLDAN